MNDEYFKLLDKAMEKIPKRPKSAARFEIPVPEIERMRKKTFLLNFLEITEKFNRDPKHILKFLSKEMATSGAIVKRSVVFQGAFPPVTVKRLVEIYANKYVICPICKSPDTKIEKEGQFYFLICEACGAKSSILET
jgi:translation initiation factor 2 subunit 2